jgi:hypothetical protein
MVIQQLSEQIFKIMMPVVVILLSKLGQHMCLQGVVPVGLNSKNWLEQELMEE